MRPGNPDDPDKRTRIAIVVVLMFTVVLVVGGTFVLVGIGALASGDAARVISAGLPLCAPLSLAVGYYFRP